MKFLVKREPLTVSCGERTCFDLEVGAMCEQCKPSFPVWLCAVDGELLADEAGGQEGMLQRTRACLQREQESG